MARRRGTTIALTAAGVVLSWLPAAAGVMFAMTRGFGDTLAALWYVPAALVPVALVGAVLLSWAASREGHGGKSIAIGFIGMVGFWLVAAAVAWATGLASGEIREGGWESMVVAALYVGYALSTIALGAAGASLLKTIMEDGATTGQHRGAVW